MPFDGTNSKALDAVRKMKVRLAKPGQWCKRTAWSGTAACLRGALMDAVYAQGGEFWIGSYENPLVNSLDAVMNDEARARGYTDNGNYNHVKFNNADRTTHADILDFLDAVERRLVAAV